MCLSLHPRQPEWTFLPNQQGRNEYLSVRLQSGTSLASGLHRSIEEKEHKKKKKKKKKKKVSRANSKTKDISEHTFGFPLSPSFTVEAPSFPRRGVFTALIVPLTNAKLLPPPSSLSLPPTTQFMSSIRSLSLSLSHPIGAIAASSLFSPFSPSSQAFSLC